MEEGVEEGRDDVITHKMDDTEEGVTSQSTFPDPPPFYKLYTPASVQKGITPPPPPPVVGNYSMFGTDFDVRSCIWVERYKSLRVATVFVVLDVCCHCFRQMTRSSGASSHRKSPSSTQTSTVSLARLE